MEISLGILAGGHGRRLGGRDKGLLIVNGRPLIGALCATTMADFSTTLINCHRNEWLYSHYADRILCDLHRGQGPVAGVTALLAACETPLLAILPCDQQHLPDTWLSHLLAGLPGTGLGCFASDGGRHTPCMLLRQSAAKTVGASYDKGCRSLSRLYQLLQLTAVEIPLMGSDLDTLDDLPA